MNMRWNQHNSHCSYFAASEKKRLPKVAVAAIIKAIINALFLKNPKKLSRIEIFFLNIFLIIKYSIRKPKKHGLIRSMLTKMKLLFERCPYSH